MQTKQHQPRDHLRTAISLDNLYTFNER